MAASSQVTSFYQSHEIYRYARKNGMDWSCRLCLGSVTIQFETLKDKNATFIYTDKTRIDIEKPDTMM